VSRQSKFAGLAATLRDKSGKGTAASPKKVAKSQDKENYKQTTVYIHTSVYNPLQTALAEAKLEYSQLVEDLLRDWLKERKS
jgi:hypothetical protein